MCESLRDILVFSACKKDGKHGENMRIYGEALRKKAKEFLDQGQKIHHVAARLGISASAVARWKALWKKTGSLMPLAPKRKRVHIPDVEVLKKYVQENPDCSRNDIVEYFKCSGPTASRRMKEAGYTYKKNLHLYEARSAKAGRIS
jgi:transposase